ncbi:hypothetical protein KY284_025124 [Solanum tuberosum]|nr:hypothetical protein KY284_025124 [Solanum tuberosum]
MAREPAGEPLASRRMKAIRGAPEKTNKTHQESSSNSSYSSTNSRNTEAMHIAISERELDGIQRIISTDRERLIHTKLFKENESTKQELQHTKKLDESIVPFERTDEAISGNFAKKNRRTLVFKFVHLPTNFMAF